MSEKSERKLTKRTIDALAATGMDAVYWDRDLQGFGVRVNANGRKVFVVQTRGPRGPKRVTLGRGSRSSTTGCAKRRRRRTRR